MGRLGLLQALAALAFMSASTVVGCAVATADGDECLVGTEGCACTPGGACDPGLLCLSHLCVDTNGTSASSGGGAHSTSGASMGPSGSTNAVTSGVGPSTTSNNVAATTGVTTGPGPSSTASGGTCSVPDPLNVMGCNSCGACDSWVMSWSTVATATHYRVRYLCGGTMHESLNILGETAELCYEAGLCSYCSGGVFGIWIEACDDTCCSQGALVPEAEAPLLCQTDCCL